MLRLRYLLVILLMVCSAAYAQKGKKYGSVRGRLVNAATKAAFSDLSIAVPSIKAFTISAFDGSFTINGLAYGTYDLVITGEYAESKTIKVIISNESTDAGDIQITASAAKNEVDNQIPTIAIEDAGTTSDDDDNLNGQNMMGYFTPAQEQFLYNTSFRLGAFRFRPRGLNAGRTFFNGFDIADIAANRSYYSAFGGLNDVLRSRDVTYGIKPSDYSFGVNNGQTNYIDATAAAQRKGSTVSYSATNRAYHHRIMLTHNSGLMKNGWAYSLSASKKWAQEGYYDGTFYDGYSFYAAASKVLKKGTLNLSAIGASTYRGMNSTAMEELYTLTDNKRYNPSWGTYKDGTKRSGRTSDVFQPMIVANYTHTPNTKTKWNTSLGYQFGYSKRGSIDFYNGYNPAPDYYRNLPSYYLQGDNTPNAGAASVLETLYKAHPEMLQIRWDSLTQANYTNFRTIENANGGTSPVSGRQSIYVFYNTVDNMKKQEFNSTIDHAVNEHLSVQGGISVIHQSDEIFKQLEDLMGGDFYVNYNQFAAQATPGNVNVIQNNLNIPNQIVKKGDKYGYDYKLDVMESHAWGQGVYNLQKFNFFAAVKLGNTSFTREGLTKSGIFPNESLGKSDNHSFFTYSLKGGVRFQPDAKNVFFANAGYDQLAPNVHNTFISERTRNTAVDNPVPVLVKSFEGGYQFKSTDLTATLTGYVSEINRLTTITRFFNDDPDIQSFVNYVMQDAGIRSIGAELSVRYKVNELFTFNGSAALGQIFYTNRPTVSIYQDNDPAATVTSKQVYIKNFYVGGSPQSIATGGVEYRPKYGTRLGVYLNYLGNNYVGMNPERRTQLALDMVTPGTKQWNDIVTQEKLPTAFTVDLSGGKTWDASKWTKLLHKGTSLVLNAGISNVLNNTDIKVAGYEQFRFDYKYKNADKFKNKYTYAMGINYFVSLALRF